jgi:hypothetical protein
MIYHVNQLMMVLRPRDDCRAGPPPFTGGGTRPDTSSHSLGPIQSIGPRPISGEYSAISEYEPGAVSSPWFHRSSGGFQFSGRYLVTRRFLKDYLLWKRKYYVLISYVFCSRNSLLQGEVLYTIFALPTTVHVHCTFIPIIVPNASC